MEYHQTSEFMESLQQLNRKNGPYRNAASKVLSILSKAKDGQTLDTVFAGVQPTNNGEMRIPHCVKYQLAGFSRLITIQHAGSCYFMFAGDHASCDHWLDANRGLRLQVSDVTSKSVIATVRVSDDIRQPDRRVSTQTDLSEGSLYHKLPEKYLRRLFEGASETQISTFKGWTSISSDEEVLEFICGDPTLPKANLWWDVFSLLRAGDILGAKNRIDRDTGAATPIEVATPAQMAEVQSGDSMVRVSDVDPELMKHFIETASFAKWMLYLHPEQRAMVEKDFSGPARMLGVSGSGKTCVIIHRAIRLARQDPAAKVLILTLNDALANLIKELITVKEGSRIPPNLEVKSFWMFCREKLLGFDKRGHLLFNDETVATNPHAVTEHIDDIWREYFRCENNNHDAGILGPVNRSLIGRGVYPEDYLRQEFEYVRSAFSPKERQVYLTMEREGRQIAFDKTWREFVLTGVRGWERKMQFVGAVDYLGVATSLYDHIDKLQAEYKHVLVDEMQDFGTLELRLIRTVTIPGANDLFLCGDGAQSVLTKHHKLADAGIDVSGRYMSIRKNYRNSREILTAAYDTLRLNYDGEAKALSKVEVLEPEFANFSSAPPLLLSAETPDEELAFALSYAKQRIADEAGRQAKACIVFCGLTLPQVEEVGATLSVRVLSDATEIGSDSLFLSDLEQTKGFEFDFVIVLNCSLGIIPHPTLPHEESYRDLFKLYVAMTRAKTELVVSHSGDMSSFLARSRERFVEETWGNYVHSRPKIDIQCPRPQYLSTRANIDDMTAVQFLWQPEAVGLSDVTQEKLIELVGGRNRFEGTRNKRQIGWKAIGEFRRELERDPYIQARMVGPKVLEELRALFARVCPDVSSREVPGLVSANDRQASQSSVS